ncbi:ester cyclase [Bacteroidota bacterium]
MKIREINFPIFIFILILILTIGCAQKETSSELKQIVDKYVEYWNTAKFEGIENILCEDFELIESPKFEPQIGIEAFKNTVTAYHSAYPDFKLIVNEVIYDKDKIAGIWTITATNTGQGHRPPTGKRVEVIGLGVIHFKDGKIKDEWIAGNNFYWYQQLGYTFIPPKSDND